MIGQVNFTSTNLLQSYPTSPVKEETQKAQTKQEVAHEIISKEAAEAVKAKAFVAPKAKPTPDKKSIDEYKADLIKEGKIEGKDFKVETKEDKQGVYGHELIILDNNKPVKSYYYDKSTSKDEELQLVKEYSYPIGDSKGLKQIETTYGADGEFHFRTTSYDKENSPYKGELVNHTTTPAELSEYFTSKGIKFTKDIEYSKDNNNLESYMISKITAFDPKTNEITRYEFEYDKDNDKVYQVTKNIINKDGSINSYIAFRKDETAFIEFEDNFKA